MFILRLLSGFSCLLVAVSTLAGPPLDWKPKDDQIKALSVDWNSYINANKILMSVLNRGDFGWGRSFPAGRGTIYPYKDIASIFDGTASKRPLYTAGIWLAGIDSASGAIRSSVAFYTQNHFLPGYIMGGNPMPDIPEFRVYKLFADSLQTNPNYDYLNWPVDQGAPVDSQGRPLMQGGQLLWSVFNDLDSAGLFSPGLMGIEVQQTVWASRGSGTTGSTENYSIYLQYKLYNMGSRTIQNMYFGLFADPDLGDPLDDLIGCDTTEDLFYCYNGTNADSVYGSAPPAIGFKYLYGLVVPSPGDTAYFNGDKLADYKNLGMAAFARWKNPQDCSTPEDFYSRLTGFDCNGVPWSNGTRYAVPGDPVTGIGDIDSEPYDKRMMGSCGPITFRPGDSQYVLIKMAVGQGRDRLSSISRLKQNLNQSIDIYYACFDMNGNDAVNILDISYLINFLYKNGSTPVLPATGDVNGDDNPNILDITYMIKFMYRGGDPPICL